MTVVPEDQFQAHNDYHYKYYVTFPEYDRRWECHLPRESINVVRDVMTLGY